MYPMHFEGSIIRADLHSHPAPLESYVELRVIIDVEEEIMIEVSGTPEVLAQKFNVDPSSAAAGNIPLLGKKCKIIRDAAGYHFISLLP